MTAVDIRALTLRIPTTVGRRPAWVHVANDVSLALTPGRMHALVGESGCGKSVLAATLSGLLPPRTRVSGQVVIGRTDVTAALGYPRDPVWVPLRGRVVGTVPQSAATAFTPTRRIRRQIEETVAALGGLRTAEDLADACHLPRWALDAYPHELSGGLIGRAALAAALAGQPSVLVADEPTASLDRPLARTVLGLLRAQADSGVAVLLITHDLGALLDGVRDGRPLVEDLSVMYAGRLVEQGPASDVWAAPSHSYTRALLDALPRNGLREVPGTPPTLTDPDGPARFDDRLRGAS